MASVEECREALTTLSRRLTEMSPQDRASYFGNRSMSCQVTDLGVTFVTRFTDHGADPVTVTSWLDGEQVVVQVDDSGDGIAEGIRQRAFTKFWTTGQRGGSGLGLYLVNGLVRAHGGTVTITDSSAGGARITMTWPAFGTDPDD